MIEGEVERVNIKVLADNVVGFRGRLLGQHGASYYVEVYSGGSTKRILVDSGWNGDALLFNMKALNLDPRSIDAIVITHGHWDHTGGLVKVLEGSAGKTIPIIMHPYAMKTAFISEPSLRPVGIVSFGDLGELKKLGGYPILSKDPVKIAPGVATTGEIERKNDFERVEENYIFVDEDGKLRHDDILDDIALVIKFKDGVGVITGCGHSGIVNILEKAISLSNSERVKFVLGGFHLSEASEERISRTIKSLSSLNIENIYAGHCTGMRAICEMRRAFGTKFKQIHVGMEIEMG
ncbi:MAG TPA: MBL fold metallo-hydrolase [Fervidicoccus fontis]|uniref:MBL fold metallo-hydrolase n=1 Tax=Fervidicoccus fontis TaxID=683846 RepID=A0A7C2YTH5_9CREN|nr:MBL fold metallo-hydrolase [Fervidicoccus fontis]